MYPLEVALFQAETREMRKMKKAVQIIESGLFKFACEIVIDSIKHFRSSDLFLIL